MLFGESDEGIVLGSGNEGMWDRLRLDKVRKDYGTVLVGAEEDNGLHGDSILWVMLVAESEIVYKGVVGLVSVVEGTNDELWEGKEWWGAGDQGDLLGIVWRAPGIEVIDTRRSATLTGGVGKGEATVTVVKAGEQFQINLSDNLPGRQHDHVELRFGLTEGLVAYAEIT